MNKSKKEFYRKQAETIIKNLELRKMSGYYCENVDEAKEKLKELLGSTPKSVAYGGSMTIDDNGFKDVVKENGHNLIVRENYTTDEEVKKLKALTVNADTFMMSTNAITLNGELINIDGRGNRVSYMIYGPDEVIILAGMNKVVANVEDGIRRVRNEATPPNTIRLNCDTPCAATGRCADCITNSICCQIVITRISKVPNRIKVILIGEELGY